MAKGDFVEILVDAGSGSAREYVIEATRAGRSVEVRSSRTTVEVRELTRTGGVVRPARLIAPRVLAVVEHPKDEKKAAQTPKEWKRSSRSGTANPSRFTATAKQARGCSSACIPPPSDPPQAAR